jgi:hypothetical protein
VIDHERLGEPGGDHEVLDADGVAAIDDVRGSDPPGLPTRRPVALPEQERGAGLVARGVVQRDAGLRLRLGEVLVVR